MNLHVYLLSVTKFDKIHMLDECYYVLSYLTCIHFTEWPN
jgi:hypothetical protein